MDNSTDRSETERPSPETALSRGSNHSAVRAYNERLVLTLIRQAGALPKAEIARITGLSPQTVSVIMRALERDGLLVKGDPIRGRVGQPSVPMSLHAKGAYFLGLKIGRRSLELILTDFSGAVQARVGHKHAYPDPDQIIGFANQAITQLITGLAPEARSRVAGLGIALPFRMWEWSTQLGVAPSQLMVWRDCDIAAEIARHWSFPVYMCNDASAACGAELVFGPSDRPQTFLHVFIGFFVGGGLVLDNLLYTGPQGNAASIGPMPLGPIRPGVKQLIDVASLYTLEQAVLRAGGTADMIWTSPEHWSLPESTLDGWLDQAAQGLAHTIAALCSLIDFECTLIDGWMPAAVRDRLVERVTGCLSDNPLPGIEAPEIRAGTIGPDARALGAASLPLSERFLVDRTVFLKG